MNANPATEYALYDPLVEKYVVRADGLVAVWPTEQMAIQAAARYLPSIEVHSRLNYAVTSWMKVTPRGEVGKQ